MWNQGCKYIANGSGRRILIVDQEDPRYQTALNPYEVKNFNGVIFPWCSNGDAIKKKAFCVYDGGTLDSPVMFYIFQNYGDDKVYYSNTYTDDVPDWNKIQWCQAEPAGYLNMFVTGQRIPICSKP